MRSITSSLRCLTSRKAPTRCQNEYLKPEAHSTPQRMFSYTERLWKMLVTWKLRDSPLRLIWNGLRPVTSSPLSRMLPELGW